MNDDELRAALGTYAARAPRTDPRPGFDARLARRARTRRVAVAACVAAVAATAGAVVAVTGPAPEDDRRVAARPEPGPVVLTRRANGSAGLRVTVTLAPGNPATGTESVLTVDATDDHGQLMVTDVDWGDGVVFHDSPPVSLCPLPMPPSSRRFPDSLRESKRHAWRHPGATTVTVTVQSQLPCVGGPANFEQAVATFDIAVRAGSTTTNGPVPPHAEGPSVVGAHEPLDRTVYATLADADGYVSGAVVDWGDGEAVEVTTPKACEDGSGRHYPLKGALRVAEVHTYPRSGTYTVTVRFTSTGCAGGDPQQSSATVTHVVPPPA